MNLCEPATHSLIKVPLQWDELRRLFPISPDWIDMSAMFITAHPTPVAEAIERYRRSLDLNPNVFLQDNNRRLLSRALDAAANYFEGTTANDIALTDSTTTGIALVYSGMKICPGQEVVTTNQDYYVTHEALRWSTLKTGAAVRRIDLYDEAELDQLSADDLVDRIIKQIAPQTRVLALTWIHSSTGVKLPLSRISASLREINLSRDLEDHVLLCVDGVHGFGNQVQSFEELGCDFFVAGCHKWIFGPRGTGIVVGTKKGWSAIAPTVPSFFDFDAYGRWIRNEPAGTTTAAAFMPGGYKAFEHLWALPEAFDLHNRTGKRRIAIRTAELALQLKEGLASISKVVLRTPRSAELSAGIVSFDIEGLRSGEVVNALRDKYIVASVAPYRTPHVRLSPSVRNSPEEVECTLSRIRELTS
jgi:selenocysteine lyase/cysteine desulfurase